MSNSKLISIDTLYSKKIINNVDDKDILVINLNNPKSKSIEQKAFKEATEIWFYNVYDVEMKTQRQINFTGAIVISKIFNSNSDFNFLKVFPKAEKIIVHSVELYNKLNSTKSNSKTKIILKKA